MSIPVCDCTTSTLTSIPASNCNSSIGFIKKWVFQLQGSEFVGDDSPATNAIETLASWTAFLNASNATKVVVTRQFTDALIPASESETETADGVDLVVRENPVVVPSMFRNLSEAEISAIEDLACKGPLCVYAITQSNQILAKYVSADVYTGIPIIANTLRLHSPELTGGFDKSMLEFAWDSDWRKNSRLITPDFDALLSIVPV